MGNPPLVVGLLINGVAYAAIFIAIAILVLRFTSEIVWRSFLVLFLFIAAGLYIVFALGRAKAPRGWRWRRWVLPSSAARPCSGCGVHGGGSLQNPISCLIPCHRVIRSTGASGGSGAETAHKKALHAREAAKP